jgi:fatty acid desaturase
MDTSLSLARGTAAPASIPVGAPRTGGGIERVADDKAMLRAAADLTRDLVKPRPAVYWADLIASMVVGYGALAVAATSTSTPVAIVAGVVAMLGLYRGLSFIHEVSHMKHASVPNFRLGWNGLVGVPLLTPSFMYEGVHNLHHAKTRYGTVEDPEYLPLALMKPWTLPLFIVIAALAPIALLIRFAILSPISLLSPKLRTMIVERYSALAINPQFRRRAPEGEAKAYWGHRRAAATRVRDDLRRRICVRGAQPGPHAGSASVGERRRADDGNRTVSRYRQRAAASPVARALGAGRSALPRAASPAAGAALSCTRRGASPHYRRTRCALAVSQGKLSGFAGPRQQDRAKHDGSPLTGPLTGWRADRERPARHSALFCRVELLECRSRVPTDIARRGQSGGSAPSFPRSRLVASRRRDVPRLQLNRCIVGRSLQRLGDI